MNSLLFFIILFFSGILKCETCDCLSKCTIQKSSMALRGRIREVEETDIHKDKIIKKLAVVAVVYVEGLDFDVGRYDLLKNETSLQIDWLPMSHDVVETSRRPPVLKSVHFVNIEQNTTAVIFELMFDILNMKLRSTYEIKVNSLYDSKCDEMIEMTSHAAMNLTFACERIIDSDCQGAVKIDHHPVCNFMRNYHTRIVENQKFETQQIDILISIEKNDHRYKKLKYFVVYYGECEPQNMIKSDECILDLQKSDVSRFCVPNRMNCSYNRSFSLTIPSFNPSTKYGIQICGILDKRFEYPPIVAGTSKIISDMLSATAMTSSLSISPSVDSLLKTLFGYAFVLAFLLIILVLFVVYKCTTGRIFKSSQNQSGLFALDENSLTMFEDRIIGKGKFGSVFVGQLSADWHGPVVLDDMQRIAIKTNKYLDKSRKRQFVDEIEGAKVVGRHSRILASIGTVVKNGTLFHVMEYCANGNLLDYLIRKRKYMIELQEKGIDLNGSLTSLNDIEFEDVISQHDQHRIASQICAGMIYLGSKSIIHNALCARHILITAEQNVKIADFGHISTPNTQNCIPIEGQQKWTALELLKGETSTQFSDVWSFGIILWEIFTLGGRPYYNVPDQAIRGLIEKGFRLQKPEGCSLQLYQMMRETWIDNPPDRPTFNQLSTRISNLAHHSSPETFNFPIISTLCDYYLDDSNFKTLSHNKPFQNNDHQFDAAALISESERLLGYRT